MIKNYFKNSTSDGAIINPGKINDSSSNLQIAELYFKDVADQIAVKQEIGDVIWGFNSVIKKAKKDVAERKKLNPIKYKQRGFYSQDLNATIKEYLIKEIETDPIFNSFIRIRSNNGSQYFIVKDKYILYIKQLYGKRNKPSSVPTPNSSRLYNGTLDMGLGYHAPILFIGPNLMNIESDDSFVTSLINRKEINWTLSSLDLFSNVKLNSMKLQPIEENEFEIVSVKPELRKGNRKTS